MESAPKNAVKEKLVRWGIFAGVLIIVFLLGLIPMWLQKRSIAEELSTTQGNLRKSEIRGLLMTAIVESNRGEYEPARQATSDFFTRLRAEIDKGNESALAKEERDKLTVIFDNRDATITMLAQRDQASVQRLTDIYENYSKAVGQISINSPPISPNTSNTAPAQTQPVR